MNKIMKILLCLLAITPIIVDSSVSSPFVTGKNILVWAIVSMVSIIFIINFLHDKKFKIKVLDRINSYYRNPIVISIFAFVSIVLVSTIFAVDKYHAFWGDLDRAEGFVGIACFVSIFVFSSLIFEKKDWLNFFKISLFISWIVLFKEFSEFLGGIGRPNSFLGNPTFLAGYLLFSVFSSSFILSEIKNNFWKYFSIITLILSIIGIFIAQTRGTILGLIIGVILVLFYGIIKGKNVGFKKINLRKLSIIVLSSIFIFSIIFISTRNNSFWQEIPGLSRVAEISNTDSTTQTRLLMVHLGVNAIDPIQNGWQKFLVGWGQDNFSLAYQKYFNPIQFDYESSIFDRAHNKFVDILVMNGVLGLLSYLFIFAIFFFYIFKKEEFSWTNMILILWCSAYLIHLLFVFDQITTYIHLFIVLSYFVYINKKEVVVNKIKEVSFYVLSLLFIIISLFLNYVFWTNMFIGYVNMHKLNNLIERGNKIAMVQDVEPILSTFVISQPDVLNMFISYVQNRYVIGDVNMEKLAKIGFDAEEEYAKKRPLDVKNNSFLAVSYTNMGKISQNLELLKKGEFYLNKLISLSPYRPEYNYNFAFNLFLQKRFKESLTYFEKSFDSNKGYFLSKSGESEKVYIYLFKYFYQEKDLENFKKVINRLTINNYSDKDNLNNILNYIEKTKTWPPIRFE